MDAATCPCCLLLRNQITGVNIGLEAASQGAHQFSLMLCSKVLWGGNHLYQIDFLRKWGLQNSLGNLVSEKAKSQRASSATRLKILWRFLDFGGHVDRFRRDGWGGVLVQNGEKHGDESWADNDHKDAIVGLSAVTKLNRNDKHDILEGKDGQSVFMLWSQACRWVAWRFQDLCSLQQR